MNYIVLDLEFNQAFSFQSGIKAEPLPECPFEIIQIGAVKLNAQFEQIDTFDFMIRPQIYTRLHPFVEKITNIHEEDLIDKPTFAEGYQAFLSFIGNEPAILCTWGPDDVKSLFRNILYYDLDTTAITDRYVNIQPFAATYLKYDAGQAIGLKNAVVELNIAIEQPFHNALYDAMYTAEILKKVHPNVIKPEIFYPLSMLTKKPKNIRTNKKALLLHFTNVLQHELTEYEKKLILSAYDLGKRHAFDNMPKQNTKNKKTKNKK